MGQEGRGNLLYIVYAKSHSSYAIHILGPFLTENCSTESIYCFDNAYGQKLHNILSYLVLKQLIF